MSDTIKQFNITNIPIIKDALLEAVKTVEKKYGIMINISPGNYRDNIFSSKLTMVINDFHDTTGDAKEMIFKTNVKHHGWKFGVSQSDLGKITDLGKFGLCEFIGCKDRISNAPLVFKAMNGDLVYTSIQRLPR